MHSQKPNRSRLWQVLLPLGLGAVLSLAGDLTLYAVLPAYASSRAFSLAAIGLILSANRLVRLGSNPLVGLLLSGMRRRPFVLIGLGMGSLSTLLYVLAGNTGMFLAGRLLWGISWSLINIGGYTMILDISDETNRGWASGSLQAFIFAGLAINPLLGGLLNDRLGFAPALEICAALSGLGFLIALLWLPETGLGPQTSRSREMHAGRAMAAHLPFTRAVLGSRLARLRSQMRWRVIADRLRPLAHPRNAAVGYIYFAANFVGDGILVSTISLYLQKRYGNAIPMGGLLLPIASTGGALLALRATTSGLIAPLAGLFSDRSHSRWRSLGWGALLGGGGLLLIPAGDAVSAGPWVLLVGVILSAAGQSIVLTLAPPLAREINPGQHSSAIVGLLANAADLGMALAPLFAYTLLGWISLQGLYILAGLGLALGVLLAWFLSKPYPAVGHPPAAVGRQEPVEDR